MDKIDLKLLAALDREPRQSYAWLGRQAGISKERAQYRVKQLQERGVLTGFFCFTDLGKLGMFTAKLLIKFKSVSSSMQQELISFVKSSDVVAWSATTEGAYDFIITTVSPTRRAFVACYEGLLGRFGHAFQRKDLLLPLTNNILNDKYLANGALAYNQVLDFHATPATLDDTDEKILRLLSENSRTSFTSMGNELDLSAWATSQRYQRLTQQGIVIALKPRVDFRKLGLTYHHLLIDLQQPGRLKDVVAYYVAHPDCIMVMTHAGTYSLHAEFVLKQEGMHTIITDLRERFGTDIARYEPLLIVEEYVMQLLR